MKTAGQMLRDARLSQKWELSDVARSTKIRERFLTDIEADNYSQLPSGATARGFIRNYSEHVSLNPEYVLAIFRRDFVENQQGQIVPRGLAEPVDKPSFWTPRSTVIAIVCALFLVFGVYVYLQYRILTGPPPLQVTDPPVTSTVTETTIVVKGSTDPEATISVNGQFVALEKGGTFSVRLPLTPGPNPISIVAISKSGKKTEVSRSVNLTAGDTPQ